MTDLKVGALRHRLTLEEPVRESDGAGGAQVAWASGGEVWAAVKPTTGRELRLADQVSGRVSHEIVMRHREGITPDKRFRMGSRIFEILAVLDVGERRRQIRCLCREEML